MKSTTRIRVHLICNAHLDPVWQWRWTEGCSEAIATFRNAVEIIRGYPDFIFNHNESILYEWIRKYDPMLFRKIREQVADGRWHISGGWFIQPDVNLPPVENIHRHIIEGKRFFKDNFGVEPRVAYNFDSFGHSPGLPGILREHGYEFYIHMRPDRNDLLLPASVYRWKGSDGTVIPAHRIEVGFYHTERNNIRDHIQKGVDIALNEQRSVAVFWGLGNHGGGATREDMEIIGEIMENEDRVDIKHSTTEGYFRDIKGSLDDAPVYEGELQRVFAGTYTSLARLKRKALMASSSLLQLEELDRYVAGSPELRRTGPSREEKINTIWRDILFNDFHDILTGSCTRIAEEDAMDLYGRAMENIRDMSMDLVNRVNRVSPKLESHIPLTVFSSDYGLSKFPVEFECMADHRPFWDEEKILVLTDREGKVIPCQEEQAEALLPFHRWRRKLVFMAEGISPGIHHYGLNPEPEKGNEKSDLFPLTGDFDLRFRVMRDTADSWGTNTWQWDDAAGEFNEISNSRRIIEHGNIRTVREYELILNLSSIVVKRINYTGWPVVEYRIRINWHGEKKRLKLVIPTDPELSDCICQVPGGIIRRRADGQEHCHGSWMQVTDGNGIPHMNVAHNGMHGYDFVPGELRLSVLRSAAYCHWHEYELPDYTKTDNASFKGPAPEFMDQGLHDIRLAIWRAGESMPDPAAISKWLNTPPLVYPHLPVG